MEPTNFNNARWHYCQIFSALTSDDAIKGGIIAESRTMPLLFFFMTVWQNDRIRRWLAPKEPEKIREKNLVMLIGWLYDKGTVFDGSCYGTTIANLLLQMNVLSSVTSIRTLKNYLGMEIPKSVRKEANSIFDDTLGKVTKKINDDEF